MSVLDAKTVFVVTNPISAVVRSQIFETVISLREKGIEADVIFFLQYKHFIKSRNILPDDLAVIGSTSSIRFLPFQNNILSQFAGALILSRLVSNARSKNVIFHCRGHRSTAIALKASSMVKNSRVIFDARGDILAETEFLLGSDEKSSELMSLERKCVQESDYSLYVSKYLRKCITERHGATLNNSSVMYCTASRNRLKFQKGDRTRIRQELGIKDEIVFIYTGSIGLWHCFDRVISVCETLARIYKNSRFLFLVNQADAAKTAIHKTEIASASDVFSAAPDEIGAYLSSSDIALLIRETHPLNSAASPVKFAEYVMNGLPIIITDAIHDYAAMIQECGNGIVLNATNCDDENYIKQIFSYIPKDNWVNMRNSYPDSITDDLSKETYVERLCDVYSKLTQH